MVNNERARKKDSSRLVWDSKPRRAPNPKDIEFQTAEVVIPNWVRDSGQIPMSFRDNVFAEQEPDKQQMNRLIWGDNLLAMQALLAQGYEGKMNLIYIDPPFWSQEQYNFQTAVQVGQVDSVERQPSFIEKLAYKDTWAGGIDSYLDMLYPRLQLMRKLLADDGSIYIHLDYHAQHYVKVALDEIFGHDKFRNEVVWQRNTSHNDGNKFGCVHDTILYYTKGSEYTYHRIEVERSKSEIAARFPLVDEETGRRYTLDNLAAAGSGPPRKFGDRVIAPPPGNHWRYSQENIDKMMAEGRIAFTGQGTPRYKRYEDDISGKPVQDIWTDFLGVSSQSAELIGFDTQKPEALLERIIKASSNEGDLVADFFCGSGTTMAEVERLNQVNPDKPPRGWIGCDLSKVAIQVTRTRLVQQDAKPFLIENIGNYQREMIYLSGGRIAEMQQVILKLYGATPRKDSADLGSRHSPEDGTLELIYVGYPDRPVTARKAEELARQAEKLDGTGYKRLVILAWDYDYNYSSELENRLKAVKQPLKTKIESRTIPPDIYDYLKKARDEEDIEPLRGKIQFYEKPYLRLTKPIVKLVGESKAEVTIGIERYVVFDLPVAQKEREKLQELIKDNFAVLIDYWAVDWDYDGYTFKSQWQDMRGNGRKTKIVTTQATIKMSTGKTYTIAVRLVDIFGNDAAGTVQVKL
jgi:adenine-specific DNA-methyltransferase